MFALLCKTNRFHVVFFFSVTDHKTSKCGKNISNTWLCLMYNLFLSHFHIICDLLLNTCSATWNQFVKFTALFILINSKSCKT